MVVVWGEEGVALKEGWFVYLLAVEREKPGRSI